MMNEKLNNTVENNGQEVVSETQGLTSLFKSEPSLSFASNQLSYTAKLTAQATKIADDILAVISENPADYEGMVLASQQSHDHMDDLINEIRPLKEEDVDYLHTLTTEEAEKMIRSQQSKRSRAKSKEMTMENYKTMMVGAIAENLLRWACGKPKAQGGGGVSTKSVVYTEEQLALLAENPEDLKKHIRNIQSKKSIMRSKQGFTEDKPEFKQLLAAEAQLKAVRDRTNDEVVVKAQEAVAKQEELEKQLENVDLESIGADEAVDLLDKLKTMLASK